MFTKPRVIISTVAMWVIAGFFAWMAVADSANQNGSRPFAIIAAVVAVPLACAFTYAAPILIRAGKRVDDPSK